MPSSLILQSSISIAIQVKKNEKLNHLPKKLKKFLKKGDEEVTKEFIIELKLLHSVNLLPNFQFRITYDPEANKFFQVLRPTINEILEYLKEETIRFIINRNKKSIPVLDAMLVLDATKEFMPILDATPVLDATVATTPGLDAFDAALDTTEELTPVLDTTESNISRAFGVVYSVEYNGKMFALKSLDNDNVNKEVSKEFIKELRQLYNISPNPNVNQFHRITHDPETNKFMLVLQFANRGHLRQYLQNKWHDGTYMIKLDKIIKFALQATSGSKGAPAYLDPYCCCQPGKKPDEKSDIYSLGVIFWELTSGVPPFANAINNLVILFQTYRGYREQAIPGTPAEYAKLYEKCWNAEPKERPTINKILENLNLMSKGKTDRLIMNKKQGTYTSSLNSIVN
ncbi:20429_t:CDS:2 [Cetraspora pellucida]|uniref:20429_t:CDS:1 n=1 Tax=Cetraspora pellucida TaxID=1433469 RepID=A0A9N9FAI4_9GLOM|nr:20429_t:CDS:2 [Cetraspora pellucida]